MRFQVFFPAGSNTCKLNLSAVVLVATDWGWCGDCYQSLVMLLLRSEQGHCSGGCDHRNRTLTMSLRVH